MFKLDRSFIFAELHKEKALAEISKKLTKDCTSKSPNAFCSREQYFVSLPFKSESKPAPFKASAALMSLSEREFCKNEVLELLSKKLIEPSKSSWACRAFVVNKYLE